MSMTNLKRAARHRREVEEGACDVDRNALGELEAEDFYAEGCDAKSIFVVLPDEEEQAPEAVEEEQVPMTFDFIAEVKGKGREVDIDELMRKDDLSYGAKARLLEPCEKPEEGPEFSLWESGSAKGEE